MYLNNTYSFYLNDNDSLDVQARKWDKNPINHFNKNKNWDIYLTPDFSFELYKDIMTCITDFDCFEKFDETKNCIGVFYSGGAASTTLILEAIKQGYYVLPIYTTYNVCFEEILWLKNLEQINNKSHKIFKPLRMLDGALSFSTNMNYHTGFLKQNIIALSLNYLDPVYYTSMKEIRLGYCKEDTIYSNVKDFENIYKAINKLINIEIPPVNMPYIELNKGEVNKLFNKYSKELDTETFEYSCEYPKSYLCYSKKRKMAFITFEECKASCGSCKTNAKHRIKPKVISLGISFGNKPFSLKVLEKDGVIYSE